jgi:hypothetical protein
MKPTDEIKMIRKLKHIVIKQTQMIRILSGIVDELDGRLYILEQMAFKKQALAEATKEGGILLRRV